MVHKKPLRILFAYNSNIEHEATSFRAGKVPAHRLFGVLDVQRLGHHASFLSTPKISWVQRPRIWRWYQAMVCMMRQSKLDAVVATHEAAALPLLVFRKLGLLRIPIVVINVALLAPANASGLRRRVLRILLKAADAVVSYARIQLDGLRHVFNLDQRRLYFVPLGVDFEFFRRPANVMRLGFCLSVGTNYGKDFPTLIEALPDGIRLIVVTDEYNAGVIATVPRREGMNLEVRSAVPIAELRKMYQQAAMQVIPLGRIDFSSGQTVLLENMASSTAVIITESACTRDYAVSGVNCLTVPPQDPVSLRSAIQRLIDNPTEAAEIGSRAAEDVQDHFSSRHFAQGIVEIIAGLK